jgi:hypothetical protein
LLGLHLQAVLDGKEDAIFCGVREQHFNVRQDARQQKESTTLLGHMALLLLGQLVVHGGQHMLQLEHQALLLNVVGFAKSGGLSKDLSLISFTRQRELGGAQLHAC